MKCCLYLQLEIVLWAQLSWIGEFGLSLHTSYLRWLLHTERSRGATCDILEHGPDRDLNVAADSLSSLQSYTRLHHIFSKYQTGLRTQLTNLIYLTLELTDETSIQNFVCFEFRFHYQGTEIVLSVPQNNHMNIWTKFYKIFDITIFQIDTS